MAFGSCYALKKVVLPASIKSLDRNPFRDTRCHVESRSPRYISKGYGLYTADMKRLVNVYGGVRKFTVPEGVEVIGEEAFSHCCQLREVSLPSTLKKIERYAFGWCERLQSVRIPAGMKKIFYKAFFRCPSLKEINIPSQETEVEYGSFLKICKVTRAGEVLDIEEATLP